MRGCVLGNTTDCPIYLESLMSGAAADILRKRKETKHSENNTLISIEGDNSSGLLVYLYSLCMLESELWNLGIKHGSQSITHYTYGLIYFIFDSLWC